MPKVCARRKSLRQSRPASDWAGVTVADTFVAAYELLTGQRHHPYWDIAKLVEDDWEAHQRAATRRAGRTIPGQRDAPLAPAHLTTVRRRDSSSGHPHGVSFSG
jgi:hypothetical protein